MKGPFLTLLLKSSTPNPEEKELPGGGEKHPDRLGEAAPGQVPLTAVSRAQPFTPLTASGDLQGPPLVQPLLGVTVARWNGFYQAAHIPYSISDQRSRRSALLPQRPGGHYFHYSCYITDHLFRPVCSSQ